MRNPVNAPCHRPRARCSDPTAIKPNQRHRAVGASPRTQCPTRKRHPTDTPPSKPMRNPVNAPCHRPRARCSDPTAIKHNQRHRAAGASPRTQCPTRKRHPTDTMSNSHTPPRGHPTVEAHAEPRKRSLSPGSRPVLRSHRDQAQPTSQSRGRKPTDTMSNPQAPPHGHPRSPGSRPVLCSLSHDIRMLLVLPLQDVSNGRFELALLPQVTCTTVTGPHPLPRSHQPALPEPPRAPRLPLSQHQLRRYAPKTHHNVNVVTAHVQREQFPSAPAGMVFYAIRDDLPRSLPQPERRKVHSPLHSRNPSLVRRQSGRSVGVVLAIHRPALIAAQPRTIARPRDQKPHRLSHDSHIIQCQSRGRKPADTMSNPQAPPHGHNAQPARASPRTPHRRNPCGTP